MAETSKWGRHIPLKLAGLTAIGWLAVGSSGGCMDEMESLRRAAPTGDSSDLASFRAAFPEAAALLDEAVRQPALSTTTGHQVRSTRGSSNRGPWRALHHDLSLDVSADGASLEIDPGAGTSFRARRLDAGHGTSRTEEGVVVVRGHHTSFFAARPRGVEELVWLHEPVEQLTYEVDLPSGHRLVRADGIDGVVELRDGEDRAVARMVASRGWEANGRPVPIDPRVEGDRVHLTWDDGDDPVVVDPEWQSGGGFVTNRHDATATLLPTGEVLVAGGEVTVGGEVLQSTELYHPGRAEFETGPPLLVARSRHAAVPLRDGRVLLLGGVDGEGNAIASAELYDPKTRTFAITTPMAQPRAGLAATLLDDGRVLVTGGGRSVSGPAAHTKEPIVQAELFDPVRGTFASAGNMLSGRLDHTATRLPSGQVLVIGGFGASGSALASAEVFTPGAGFAATADMGEGRFGHLAVLLPNGKVLVAGGFKSWNFEDPPLASAELFAPDDGVFAAILPMVAGRGYAASCLLPDGTLLIAGGEYVLGSGLTTELGTTERFVPDASGGAFDLVPPPAALPTRRPVLTNLPGGSVLLTGRSSAAQLFSASQYTNDAGPSLLVPRVSHRTTLLANGDLLVSGGDNAIDTVHDTFEVLRKSSSGEYQADPDASGAMTSPRVGHTSTLLSDGRVLLAGGVTVAQQAVGTADLVDPRSRQVETVALAVPRAYHAATLLPDGRVLLTGGMQAEVYGGAAIADAEIFDPARNLSTATRPLVEARLGHTATTLVDGRVLITGGAAISLEQEPLASAERFDPQTETFVALPPMAVARRHHMATTIPDGRVLIAGGTPGTVEPPVELFDAKGGEEARWTTLPATVRRSYAASLLLPSGQVLLSGGKPGGGEDPHATFDLFDPLDGTVTTTPLAIGRAEHTATLLPTGEVLLMGGLSGEFGSLFGLSTSEVLRVQRAPTGLDLPTPDVSAAPAIATAGQEETIAGSAFASTWESSGGRYPSPSDWPVSLWLPTDGPPAAGAMAPWTETSAVWSPPAASRPGPGILFVSSHGLLGEGVPLWITPAPTGIPCEDAGACASGHCADGICCDAACEGTCESCLASEKGDGQDGSCGPIAAETDPGEECPELEACGAPTGFCGGDGGCAPCPGGHCSEDGSSLITPEAELDCAPFTCSPEIPGCLTTCSSKLDCAPGLACTAQGTCEAPATELPSSCAMATKGAGSPRRANELSSVAWLFALAAAAGRLRARRYRKSTVHPSDPPSGGGRSGSGRVTA